MMLPLLFCSILAFAIVIERLWVLRQGTVVPKGLAVTLVQDIKGGRLDSTLSNQYVANSPLGALLIGAVSAEKPLSRQMLQERLEARGKLIVSNLYKHLNLLGSIAAIAPLLGLLGTVIGMIEVFSVIMEAGTGQAQPLAGGISEALVSTATGLSIGIPALFFSRYLHRRVEVMTLKLEEGSRDFLDLLMPEDMHHEI